NIIGKPNVGKSTLMNRLMGEKLSIITSKAQTTRHRILGLLNGEDYQIVLSDTPGIIKPAYELQKSMMKLVRLSIEDADILLLMVEAGEKFEEETHGRILKSTAGKKILIINKIDKIRNAGEKETLPETWGASFSFDAVIPVSALEGTGTDRILPAILAHLPGHPPYYPKDQLSDKPERFFASEIIREKIFLTYRKEVPYSTEVVITDFDESEEIIRIRAEIYVERNSQKGIIIGKGGLSLKKVGTEARKDLESFFGKQVFLETYVRVEKDWRNKPQKLTRFGYNS
ncbi:MAG: GTPase Era, partial [Cyclobacteriaceae bacterium]|nr:GTPase Era [Cyclobacteriaceae bacterium]